MKYMGSKRAMLFNGLGDLLRKEAICHERVVDLFSGSGSVSWFVAQEIDKPVLAIDLQTYSSILAQAVVGRTEKIDFKTIWPQWKDQILSLLFKQNQWKKANILDSKKYNTATWCKCAREFCKDNSSINNLILTAYGGYYYSPTQALMYDAMLNCTPKHEPLRSLFLAAMIISASKCVASPGHTAQPFRPTRSAGPFLREAWLRNPIKYFEKALQKLSFMHAKVRGQSKVADALEEAKKLKSSDLVFIDPPYSSVHYSRFYHVLESMARGTCGQVEGAGRYPSINERPQSLFSNKSESSFALSVLMERLSHANCTVLFTFPSKKCSNGLSGDKIEYEANKWFNITKKIVNTCFSTLGGNNTLRMSRNKSEEMILLLNPR